MTRARDLVTLLALMLTLGCHPATSPMDLSAADAGRPATLTGPATTARPLLTITDLPGYYCPVTHTLLPAVVVYDDGYVLAANRMGAYCDPVPTVQVGWVNPTAARVGAAAYFGSPNASVDMTDLPSVYDLPSVRVDFADPAGRRTVTAYGLKWTDSVPAEQRDARALLRAFVDQVRTLGGARSAWNPTQLSVVRTHGPVQDPAVISWPLPVTKRWLSFFAGPADSCVGVSGADAAALLHAHRTAQNEATWVAGGHRSSLALGVVLPGFSACAN